MTNNETFPVETPVNAETRYPGFVSADDLAADPRATCTPRAWLIHSSRGPRFWPVGILYVTPVGVTRAYKYAAGMGCSFDNAIDAVAWLLQPTAHEVHAEKRRAEDRGAVARMSADTKRTNTRLRAAHRASR